MTISTRSSIFSSLVNLVLVLLTGVSLANGRATGEGNLMPGEFDHLEQSCAYKELQIKEFPCLWKPVALLLKILAITCMKPQHIKQQG